MPPEGWGLPRVFDDAKYWVSRREDDELPEPTDAGSSRALVHPLYMHSNATPHTWVFGALAEVVDNSVDAGATKVEVDVGEVSIFRDGRRHPERSLEVTDNGGGMKPMTLRRCFGYGHSEGKGPDSIGGFGNGLKSGSMRLGAVTLVITRSSESSGLGTVGLYSYLYNARECGDTVRIPQVSWDSEMNPVGPEHEFNTALNLILKWGPYEHLQDLWDKLLQLPKTGGTKVVISYLWNETREEDKLELDFDSDGRDVWRPEGVKGIHHMRSLEEGESLLRDNSVEALKEIKNKMSSAEAGKQRFDMGVLRAKAHRFSLREYLKILYLPSRFKDVSWDGIYLRGWKVDLEPITAGMQHRETSKYRPQRERNADGSFEGVEAADHVYVDLGFMRESPQTAHHGVCIYRRGRLILAYVEIYKTNWSTGRGVIGVVEQEHIYWDHTKQQLAQSSPAYTKLVNTVIEKIKKYWGNNASKVGYKADRHDSAKEKKRKAAEGSGEGGGGAAGPDTPSTPGCRRGRKNKKNKVQPKEEPKDEEEEEDGEEEEEDVEEDEEARLLGDIQREANGLRRRAKAANDKAETSSRSIGRTARRQRPPSAPRNDSDSDSDIEDMPLSMRVVHQQNRGGADKAPASASASDGDGDGGGEGGASSRKVAELQEQLKRAEDKIRELQSESEASKRREGALLRSQGAMKLSLDKVKESLKTLRHCVAGYCCDDSASRRELFEMYKTCTEDGIISIPKLAPRQQDRQRSRTPTPPPLPLPPPPPLPLPRGDRGHDPIAWPQDHRDRKFDVRDNHHHPGPDGTRRDRDRGRGRDDSTSRPQQQQHGRGNKPHPHHNNRHKRFEDLDDDKGFGGRDNGYGGRRRTPSPERGWPPAQQQQQQHPGSSHRPGQQQQQQSGRGQGWSRHR